MLQGDQQCFSEKSADISRGIYIDKVGLTYDVKQLALLWDPPKTTQSVLYILYKLAPKLYVPEEAPKLMLAVPLSTGTVMDCVPGALSTPFTAMLALPPLICKQRNSLNSNSKELYYSQ